MNITLTLTRHNLKALRHICRTNLETVMNDPEATPQARKMADDLYQRVILLDKAVDAEEIAANTRAKYDRYVDGKGDTARANGAQKPRNINTGANTTAEEKPLEQPSEPPQEALEADSISSAEVVPRTV